MNFIYQILKIILVILFIIEQQFSPDIEGGDFPPGKTGEPGNSAQYIQISADDEGFEIWRPVQGHGGYRYGPSMILNSDGSLDIWSASNGPGDLVDLVSYKRLSSDFKTSTKEVIALKPTAESYDGKWTCDPGTIKFGDCYYIGYTTSVKAKIYGLWRSIRIVSVFPFLPV